MTVAIVDLFEPVHIDVHDRYARCAVGVVPEFCGLVRQTFGLNAQMTSEAVARALSRRIERTPVMEALKHNWREVILTALLRTGQQTPFYIFTTYVFAYCTGVLKLNRDFLLWAVLAASVLSFISIPLSGHISDRIGRKKMYLIGAATIGVFGFVYFGMVDTAVRYGQSVYSWGCGFDADEFSAMPSVHVGWALIVAIAVITVSRSRWRWLAAAYPVVTMLIVVVTANHFWLDGIVAALLVVLVLVVQRMAAGLRSGNSSQRAEDEPVRGEISVRS